MMSTVLSPGQAAIILFGLFFLFMFLRVPVAFALALACVPFSSSSHGSIRCR